VAIAVPRYDARRWGPVNLRCARPTSSGRLAGPKKIRHTSPSQAIRASADGGSSSLSSSSAAVRGATYAEHDRPLAKAERDGPGRSDRAGLAGAGVRFRVGRPGDDCRADDARDDPTQVGVVDAAERRPRQLDDIARTEVGITGCVIAPNLRPCTRSAQARTSGDRPEPTATTIAALPVWKPSGKPPLFARAKSTAARSQPSSHATSSCPESGTTKTNVCRAGRHPAQPEGGRPDDELSGGARGRDRTSACFRKGPPQCLESGSHGLRRGDLLRR
jgi:hypothetical protein